MLQASNASSRVRVNEAQDVYAGFPAELYLCSFHVNEVMAKGWVSSWHVRHELSMVLGRGFRVDIKPFTLY